LILVYEVGKRFRPGIKNILVAIMVVNKFLEEIRMAKKQELTKEFAMKIVKAANKASKELGSVKNKKPHK
jgi:hypothetical protein